MIKAVQSCKLIENRKIKNRCTVHSCYLLGKIFKSNFTGYSNSALLQARLFGLINARNLVGKTGKRTSVQQGEEAML